MLAQPSPVHQNALVSSIANDRLKRFRAVFGGDTKRAVLLYHADLRLAAALHSLLAVTEVCLREALHRQLSQLLGPAWFTNTHGLFDSRTEATLQKAQKDAGFRAPPGKVVAEVPFGGWTGLLGPGGWSGAGARRRRMNYETSLWHPALAAAFPNSSSSRAAVADLATRVRYARNRVAHHEPVVFGVPLPGQAAKGQQARRAPGDVLEDIRSLCEAVDKDVGDWLRCSPEADAVVADPLVVSAVGYMSSRVLYR